MKFSAHILLFAFFYLLGGTSLSAQETTVNRYISVDYIKVEPGTHANYLEVEKAWKKIHQANIKAGKYNFWGLERVASPSGANVPHNYVTRTIFSGEKQLAEYMTSSIFPDNLEAILTEAEMELVRKTASARVLVNTDVFSRGEHLLPDDMAPVEVAVFNYFDFPEGGGRSAHIASEKDIWMPVHQARIDDKKLLGWVMLHKRIPYGANQTYHDATVDLYASMEDFLKYSNPTSYVEKVHAGKNLDDIWAQTEAAATLIGAEVRVKIDDSNSK